MGPLSDRLPWVAPLRAIPHTTGNQTGCLTSVCRRNVLLPQPTTSAACHQESGMLCRIGNQLPGEGRNSRHVTSLLHCLPARTSNRGPAYSGRGRRRTLLPPHRVQPRARQPPRRLAPVAADRHGQPLRLASCCGAVRRLQRSRGYIGRSPSRLGQRIALSLCRDQG